MTTPRTVTPKGTTSHQMSKRDSRPLLIIWAITAAAVLFWWYGIHHLAVWAELLKPLLPLLFVPALWRTWRWIHVRRRDDRRDHDRRHETRRE